MPATYHIAQTFRKDGKRLIADPMVKFKTAEEAAASARRSAVRKAGAAAYSITGDMESDAMDDPVVLFRAGQLPAELQGED